MQLLLVNHSQHATPKKFIQEWLTELAILLQKKRLLSRAQAQQELTLVFMDKKSAQKINQEFRGKNYATDVLSFAPIEDDSFGELVLCPDVLERQAQEHGLTYKEELGYMLLHGVLHLLGYDHEISEAEAKRMFTLQDKLFEQLLERV